MVPQGSDRGPFFFGGSAKKSKINCTVPSKSVRWAPYRARPDHGRGFKASGANRRYKSKNSSGSHESSSEKGVVDSKRQKY